MDIKINNDFFTQLGRSPEVERAVLGVAEAAAEVAKATAPVDSGDYKNGIRAELRRGRGRSVGRVESTDGKTMLIESRTGNLHRALRSVK